MIKLVKDKYIKNRYLIGVWKKEITDIKTISVTADELMGLPHMIAETWERYDNLSRINSKK